MKEDDLVRAAVERERLNEGPPGQAECCRCECPTESAPSAAASINGVEIDDCPLCVDCRMMAAGDMKKFLASGWLRFGGTREAES